MAIVQSATEAILDRSARGWSYAIPLTTRPDGAESMICHLELDNDNNWYLGQMKPRLNLARPYVLDAIEWNIHE